MHFAMGLFFVLSALVGRLRAGGLLAALAFLTGLVSGRITSFVRDGVPDGTGGAIMLGLLAAEMIGLLLIVGALLKRRAPAPAPVVVATPPPPPPPVSPVEPTAPGGEAL
jgi:4-amino-4-deoxy-L-arabinose transferase-like glycosyltransferase